LDIAGIPTLTFEAKNLREANEVCRENWLLDDLLRLTSNGMPLLDGRAKLRVRYAAETEADIYRNGPAIAQVPDDDLVMVYLVELDGTGERDPLVADPSMTRESLGDVGSHGAQPRRMAPKTTT
jgi:hypothetical protein